MVEFHLGIGGPLYRVGRVAHLSLPRLIVAVIAVTWLPLLLLSFIEWRLTGRGAPILGEPATHVRFLLAIPLILLAERLLDRFCAETINELFQQGIVPGEHQGRVRALLRRIERWRDSSWPEAVILLLSAGIGIGTFFGVLHQPGTIQVGAQRSMPEAWFALISLPVFQFFLWRSLFRWLLWACVLGGLAGVPLRLHASHADRRGGIGFLKDPSVVYCGPLLLAVSSVLCAGWTNEVLRYGVAIARVKPIFAVFIGFGALLAFGPLMVFVPMLAKARVRGRWAFSDLLNDYSSRFEAYWLAGRSGTEHSDHNDHPELGDHSDHSDHTERGGRGDLLGNLDFQGLSELGNAYRENVDKMRPLLFSLQDVMLLVVVSLLPTLPLLLSRVPASQILSRLFRLLSGGFPG